MKKGGVVEEKIELIVGERSPLWAEMDVPQPNPYKYSLNNIGHS